MNNIYAQYLCDQVTGNVKNGFVAQFIPGVAGLHVVLVEYNGVAVGGTPFYCKVNCVWSENILPTEKILTIKKLSPTKIYYTMTLATRSFRSILVF